MIKNKITGVEGRLSYYDQETKQEAGYISYTMIHKVVLRAEHTIVDDAFQGRGIARALADELITICRRRGFLVRPKCPYIAKLFERLPEWGDLLETYDSSATILEQLRTEANPEQAQASQRYFKMGKGEYAEGDIFLGIAVPRLRQILRQRSPWTLETARSLAQSELHDARWLAFAALVQLSHEATSSNRIAELYKLYLSLTHQCNNWDLVDLSAPTLAGVYWATHSVDKRKAEITRLANTDHLWTQRIAVVGTLGLIRQDAYDEAIEVCLMLKDNPHHLIHKAMGWILREIYKRSPEYLKRQLNTIATQLPRTTLRYAIERMPQDERNYYLNLKA